MKGNFIRFEGEVTTIMADWMNISDPDEQESSQTDTDAAEAIPSEEDGKDVEENEASHAATQDDSGETEGNAEPESESDGDNGADEEDNTPTESSGLSEEEVQRRIEEYDGELYDDLPEREPGEKCNARKTLNGTGKYKGYCKNKAGKGTEHLGEGRCSFHGGGSTNNKGRTSEEMKGNTNGIKHYAYSSLLQEDMSDDEKEWAEDTLQTFTDGDMESRAQIAADAAAECLVRYRRSKDTAFLKEFRLLSKEFNLIPNSENINMNQQGGIVVNLPGNEDGEDDVIDVEAEIQDSEE